MKPSHGRDSATTASWTEVRGRTVIERSNPPYGLRHARQRVAALERELHGGVRDMRNRTSMPKLTVMNTFPPSHPSELAAPAGASRRWRISPFQQFSVSLFSTLLLCTVSCGPSATEECVDFLSRACDAINSCAALDGTEVPRCERQLQSVILDEYTCADLTQFNGGDECVSALEQASCADIVDDGAVFFPIECEFIDVRVSYSAL